MFDPTCLFDHMFYLNRLRQLGVFCHVNSTFCGLLPLKDCKGSDRPRLRLFWGIHCRCHTHKSCSLLVKKNKKKLPCFHAIWRIAPISLPLYQIQSFSSQAFCSIYHMRFRLLCSAANFVTFLISPWVVSDKFPSLTLQPHSLPSPLPSSQKNIFYSIDWLAYIKPRCYRKASFESSVPSPRLSTASCQPHQRRRALRHTKLNWSAL